MCYYNNAIAHQNVLAALDALSAANNETGRYDYWFKSFVATLEGRGRMGSLVGASEDVRKHGGQDAGLNEYAVSTFNANSNIEALNSLTAMQSHPDQRYPLHR